MPIVNGVLGDASDFISLSQRNITPSSDQNKVAKLEADGRLSQFFVRNGAVLLCGETINGGTTPVPVYQNKTDNELYACDANDLNRLKFIGFVVSNGTDGNTAIFQGSGVVSGFSGLQEGEKYYVQDAVGTIGTSPGTYSVLVGVAISETQLLIQKGLLLAAGSGTVGGASGSLAVTCGFRPSRIRISAYATLNTTSAPGAIMLLSWQNGVITAVSHSTDATNSIVTNLPRFYTPTSPANYMTFAITSVTDTGFTIQWTETGNFSPTDEAFLWEAEGDL